MQIRNSAQGCLKIRKTLEMVEDFDRSLFLFFHILILLSDCTETILNLHYPGNWYTGIIDIE